MPGSLGPATRGLRGSALLLNPRREAVAAAAGGGGGGARSAAPRPGRSRGLQRSRAEPEPSPDAVRPPAGSRESRPTGRPEPHWWQRGEPHARGSAADRGRDWGGAAALERVTGAGTAASGTLLPRPAGRERECVDPTLETTGARTCSFSRGREDPPHCRDRQKRSPQGRRCPSHAGSGGDPQKSGRVVGLEGPGVRPSPLLTALQFGTLEAERKGAMPVE